MYPVTSWHCVPPVSRVSGRGRTKTADPALAVNGSGLWPALSSDQTRNTRFPSAVSTYDIDSEHAYIMAQALCSYREHRRRETTKASGPAGLLRQYTKAAGPVSPPRDDHVAGSRDVPNTPGPLSQSEYRLPARDRRCRSAVGSTSPAYGREPLMLVMTRTRRPRTAGGVQLAPLYEPDRVDAIEQVGAANAAARVHRPNIGRHLQRTSLVWPFTMDKIGQKERGASGTPNRYQCESTCFASTSSPRKQFTIHPDWVSENLTVAKINLKERTSSVPHCDMTGSPRRSTGITGYPMRRCCSAPPSRTRNPITWEYN